MLCFHIECMMPSKKKLKQKKTKNMIEVSGQVQARDSKTTIIIKFLRHQIIFIIIKKINYST